MLGAVLVLVGVLSSATGVFAALTDTAATGALSVASAEVTGGALAVVGDRVWSDVDHDGVQDLGEPGRDGVTVTLLDAAGDPVALDGLGAPVTPQTSAGGGAYRFDDLLPGTYRLAFSGLPAGTQLTHQGGVPGDGTDSDPDPGTGRTGPVDLAAGEVDLTVDAGVWDPAPALALEKRAQGDDADTAPGPTVAVGATVTFDYLVTNTGNEALVDLAVDDDRGVVVSCPQTTVARGETVACTGTAPAVAGAYTNVGTATATGGDSGQAVAPAQDAAHYTGVEALLSLEKQVEGDDADSATAPVEVDAGQPVEFTFEVANVGSEAVANITLHDGPDAIVCPQDQLAPGASMACSPLVTTAQAGLHTNVATVAGEGAQTGATAGATDSASYRGLQRSLSFLKEVLDPVSGAWLDADDDAGTPGTNDGVPAVVAAGGDAHFRFTLANTGLEPLASASVTDPRCDAAPAVVSGDGSPAGTLDVGETWLLTCTDAGVTADLVNTATASAGGLDATERAAVQVVSGAASVALTKQVRAAGTGGFGPEATLAPGTDAEFRLAVTNTGERAVHDVQVGDPSVPGCERTFPGPIAPGASTPPWTCTQPGVTVPFTNEATVVAQPAGGGDLVDDRATARVLLAAPEAPDLSLTKSVDEQTDRTVVWRLVVRNAGPGPAPGPIVVEDRLPAGLVYVSASGGGFSCTVDGPLVRCTRASGLAEGASAAVRLTTRAAPDAAGALVNTAEVLAGGADADPADNVASAQVALGGGPDDPGPGGSGSGTGPGGPGDDAPGPLALTGLDVLPLVVSGLALIAIGAVLLWHARRRAATR